MWLGFIGLILTSSVCAQTVYTVETVPNPKSGGRGYVSNPDEVLSDNAVFRLNILCDGIEKNHGAQCAVVVLRSIGSAVPKNFATELFNHWGVGGKEKDSGLLLLIVMDQRRSEFETGYGMEEFLPDMVCVRLLENHLNPKFKAGLYDEGVINVMQAVNNELTDHEVRDYFKSIGLLDGETKEKDEGRPWILFFAFILFYGVVAYFIWNGNEEERNQWRVQTSASLPNSQKKKYKTKLRIAPLPRFWLFVALAPFPATMTLIFASESTDSATLWGGFFLFGYFSLLFGLLINRIYRTRAIRKHYAGDPYKIHQTLNEDHSGWWIALIVFFPVFILYYLPYWFSKMGLRKAPRNGPKTGLPMRRLSEAEEDKYLTPGQQKEEKLGSVDYDVWVTPNAEEIVILRYPSWWSSYTDCPQCQHKTLSQKTTTVVQPTYTGTGTGQTVYTCHHCGHTKTTTFVIPKKERSESSDGSSWSSSGSSWSSGGRSWSSGGGSSSWGGGSSGGGGGGSSW